MGTARPLAFLALLLLGPAAAASPSSGTVVSNGEVRFDGVDRLELLSAGVEALLPEGTSARLDLVGLRSASIVVLTKEWAEVRAPERIATVGKGTEEGPPEPARLGSGISVEALAGGGVVRVLPVRPLADPLAVAAPTRVESVALGPTGRHWPAAEDHAFAGAASIAHKPARPESVSAVARLTEGILHVEGPLHILATGVAASDGTNTVRADSSEDGSTVDPATGSGRYVREVRVLVLEADAVDLHADPAALRVATLGFAADVRGTARWSGVLTAADVGGEPLPHEAGLLSLSGRFAATGQLNGDEASWRFSGQVTGVAIDGAAWRAEPAAASLALTLAAVAALLFTKAGHALITLVVGRHTPRLVKAEALGSPTRRRILAEVHAHQPLTLRDLATRVGISATNASYHLRILQGHSILQTTRPAGHSRRNTLYMLNSGSLQARVPSPAGGAATVRLDVALGATQSHPVRKEIVDDLVERGPASHEEMVARRPDGHLARMSRSNATYHLQVLERSGILQATRSGRTKRYAATVTPASSKAIQYRSFLITNGLFGAFKGAVTVGERGLASMAATREEARRMRAQVRHLRDLGLLVPAAGGLQAADWLQPFLDQILRPVDSP